MIRFNKYKEKGACHIKEAKRSIFKFNLVQQSRFETVLKLLGNVKNGKVVDLGCGDGALTALLVKDGNEVTGVDDSLDGLNYAKEYFQNNKLKAKWILSNVEDIKLPDNFFDAAISSEVIEHLERPDRFFDEASRILKPGGKLVLTTPYRLTEEPMDSNHYHEFYPQELKKMASRYFSRVEVVETQSAFWWNTYAYNFKLARNRPLFRYLLNFLFFCFKFNPFLRDNSIKTKWEHFHLISLIAYK